MSEAQGGSLFRCVNLKEVTAARIEVAGWCLRVAIARGDARISAAFRKLAQIPIKPRATRRCYPALAAFHAAVVTPADNSSLLRT